jgi:hypothetical protein
MKNKLFALLALTLLCAFNFQLSTASAQGTTFTYQGRLDVDGTPANGVYDFSFRAFNALTNGLFFGGAVTVPAVAVSNGLFTVSLAFNSAAFDGSARWLDIGVTTNGGATFSSLTPRQPVTATPYAMIAGNVTGVIPLAQLPASVVTNGASGINITGTFSGNGAGVTNVDLALNSGGSIRLGTGDFILNSSPGVGNTPYSVTAADVNGDGKVDLISANYAANTLTVLTNNGSGGFMLASSPAVGSHPNSVTAADVNGDGKPDLISANFSASTLTVLTNNGSGGFVLASSPGVGTGPFSVVAADVNGDGKPDLISANYSASTLTVLTNNGSGGFALASTLTAGSSPESVTAADFNGDGKPDLISANSGNNTLTVLTNNGSGGFVLASSPGVGSFPTSVTAADVNGDGKVDLITANLSASTLTVLTNNGSGGFVLASSPGVGSFPSSVTAADVNGDGKVDLITANGLTNTLTVLMNNGSGGFVLASSPSLGSSPQSVTAADVNGDGKLDLISANGVANNLTIWFNATGFNGVFVGTGQFSSASFGTASFGASLGPKLNLYNTTFGLGIQNSVLYSRVAVGGGFGWFAGGVHNDNTFNAGGGSVLMTLTSGGLAVNGTFVSASDRNIKQDFSEVDSRAVLEKVAQLPIQTWVYKNDPGTKHLGPMAQDFYAAFAVGPDDKHITTVDESGVALAAIQGLNQKLEKQRAENAELKRRLEMLERLMSGGVK